MKGLPVTVRLFDPPLHELLSSLVKQSLLARRPESTGGSTSELRVTHTTFAQVKRLHELSPVLGTRGYRLAVLYPKIPAMQIRAIIRVVLAVLEREGETIDVGAMIPLTVLSKELEIWHEIMERAVVEKLKTAGEGLDVTVGTTIELPWAILVADQITKYVDLFSSDTNDLTQTGIDISRDDAKNGFLIQYTTGKVLERNPFESIGVAGIGQLVDIGVARRRSIKPNLKTGVCGEYGSDPDPVEFFQFVGLDYVSCSLYRVPTARFAAAKAMSRRRED